MGGIRQGGRPAGTFLYSGKEILYIPRHKRPWYATCLHLNFKKKFYVSLFCLTEVKGKIKNDKIL